jgi:hypothetical protein
MLDAQATRGKSPWHSGCDRDVAAHQVVERAVHLLKGFTKKFAEKFTEMVAHTRSHDLGDGWPG